MIAKIHGDSWYLVSMAKCEGPVDSVLLILSSQQGTIELSQVLSRFQWEKAMWVCWPKNNEDFKGHLSTYLVRIYLKKNLLSYVVILSLVLLLSFIVGMSNFPPLYGIEFHFPHFFCHLYFTRRRAVKTHGARGNPILTPFLLLLLSVHSLHHPLTFSSILFCFLMGFLFSLPSLLTSVPAHLSMFLLKSLLFPHLLFPPSICFLTTHYSPLFSSPSPVEFFLTPPFCLFSVTVTNGWRSSLSDKTNCSLPLHMLEMAAAIILWWKAELSITACLCT